MLWNAADKGLREAVHTILHAGNGLANSRMIMPRLEFVIATAELAQPLMYATTVMGISIVAACQMESHAGIHGCKSSTEDNVVAL